MGAITITKDGWTFTWYGGKYIIAVHPRLTNSVRMMAGPWDPVTQISSADMHTISDRIEAFLKDEAWAYWQTRMVA